MIESPSITNASVVEHIKNESAHFSTIAQEVSKVIVGQQEVIQAALMALLCNGHILLEGVPGLAKTTLIKALARALGLKFNRIQFTPDLLPADVIGTLIYNQKTQEFETKKGPIFANLILADEINRAPAKVQSALLEAMQEQQVTIGSTTFLLEQPFLVFATQNPIDQEGTYRLPEAQIDRFLFKVLMQYPTKIEERELLRRSLDITSIMPVMSGDELRAAQQLVKGIYVDERIIDYIVSIVQATRAPESAKMADLKDYIECGASPRATLALFHAGKAHAFLKRRHFVTPDDIKAVVHLILRSRITLSYHAEAERITTDAIVRKIMATIACP